MKWMKSAAALGLAALMTLSLAACSGGNEDETVAAALEKVKDVNSVTAVVEMAAQYASDEQNLSVTNRMTLTSFRDPLKLKAEVVLDMVSGEDSYTQTVTMYAQKEGESLVQYATDGSYWAKQTTTEEVLDAYSAGDTLSAYLDDASGFRKRGSESVNGAETVKYTGSISGAPLVKILETNGYLESIAAMSEDQQNKIKTNLEAMPAAEVTVWVNQEGYLVKMEMDMMKVIQEMEANIDETLGHPSTAAAEEGANELVSSVIRMTCADFDSAADFEIPAEALEAEDVTQSSGDTQSADQADGAAGA